MKAKRHKQKEAVTITLTKQEAWDLQMVCHAAKIHGAEHLQKYKEMTETLQECKDVIEYYKHHKELFDNAAHFEQLICESRFTDEIEEAEI